MDAIWAAYRSTDGVGGWLTDDDGGATLAVGDAVRLNLQGDGPPRLTGHVLATTGRELLLSWEETDGVLGLKAFSTPGGRMTALDYSSWASEPRGMGGWLRGRVGALGEAVG